MVRAAIAPQGEGEVKNVGLVKQIAKTKLSGLKIGISRRKIPFAGEGVERENTLPKWGPASFGRGVERQNTNPKWGVIISSDSLGVDSDYNYACVPATHL